MSLRSLRVLAFAALAASSAGCPKPPPPPPPPEPVAAPPPPPKCESVVEKCVGTPDTRAKITSSDLVFTPAVGWVYAQQSSSTIAQTGETGPAIAFVGVEFDAKDAKKEAAAKDAALGELLKQLGMSPLKRKIGWRTPSAENKTTINGLTVNRWQVDKGGSRAGKTGPLLVVAAVVGDGKAVIGVGFVPDDDTTKADDAIMKSFESLGKAQ